MTGWCWSKLDPNEWKSRKVHLRLESKCNRSSYIVNDVTHVFISVMFKSCAIYFYCQAQISKEIENLLHTEDNLFQILKFRLRFYYSCATCSHKNLLLVFTITVSLINLHLIAIFHVKLAQNVMDGRGPTRCAFPRISHS